MRQRPIIEALEPRILYSADLGPVLAPAVIGPADAEQRVVDPHIEFTAQNEQAVQNAPHEIVFIDARTPDYALLVQDIAAQSGRQLDVVMLDADRDGLAQISEALAGRENVAALHIIGHGGDGVIQLGNELVTADSLQGNPGQVESWSKALTADADILLYGCDVAATAQGQLLTDTLARLTGADVSASDNPTGSAALGGDWNLEYATGTIDVPVALSESAQEAWFHLLPSVVLTSYEPPFANMTDNAYEVSGGVTYAQSFSYNSLAGTYTVNEINVVLYKNISSSGGNVTVELRDGLGGGSSVIASGSVARQSVGTSEGWVAVSLSAPATLADNTIYFISIKGTGPGNVFVGVDNAGTYAGGSFVNDGTPEPAKDLAFRVVSNPAPVLDLNGAAGVGQDVTAAFTEQTPVLIAPSGTIVDFDSANMASLTATITARPDGDAVESLSLNAAATAAVAVTPGMNVAYTAGTGVLSITGSAPKATYQTILQGIQYSNTSDAPTTTDRIVSVVASDGTTPSVERFSFITVSAVNDAPVNMVPGAQATNEDTALVFSVGGGNAISIVDDAGTNPVQVALTGTNGVITLAGTTGLTFSVGDGTADAAMTFSGTVGAINSALDGLSFAPTANYSGAASLSITTGDQGNTGAGGPLSDADTVAITVVQNAAPTVAASGGTTLFTEGNNVASTPVVLDNAVTVSDPDSTTLASATVSIGAGWQVAEDVLGFTSNPATMGNIAGSYNAATGALSLSSAGATATLAQWQAALRSVTYTNTSDTPSTAVRTVSVVVTGEGGSSAASTQSVAVTAVNDAPMVTASGGTVTYDTAGAAIPVDGGVAVSDLDHVMLTSATVSISGGFRAAEDALSFVSNPATMGNITGSYNAASGALSLSSAGATATLAQWQAALRAVTYSNATAAPFNGIRTVSFELSDGAAFSAVTTRSLAVSTSPVVDPPVPAPPVVDPPVSPPPVVSTEPGPTVVVTPPTAGNPAQQSQSTLTSGRPVAPAGGTSLPIDAEFLTPAVNSSVFASIGGSLQVLATSTGLSESRFSAHGIAAPDAKVIGELIADLVKQVEVRAVDLFQLGEQQGRSEREEGLGGDLERLRDSLREQNEIQTRTVVTLTAGSLSMTLAYLVWLIRGGALAASMLSALPAWRLLDPLPVLARMNDEDDQDGEEDEHAIASFSDAPEGAKPA